MGLDHPDHIFGTILDVYVEAGSTRTNDVIDNSRPCDRIRKLCGSSHITPKFVTHVPARNVCNLSYFVTGTYPNINSGCHHHPIGMDYLYGVIFKMAASEVKLRFHSASRIDRDNILVSKPMFFWMKNPMMPLKILG